MSILQVRKNAEDAYVLTQKAHQESIGLKKQDAECIYNMILLKEKVHKIFLMHSHT